MNRVKVKICGITNEKDAISAANLGVDALGFNFYKNSKRYIDPKLAKNIITKLPPFITCVGLFVNQTKEYVNQVLDYVDFDILQFHGDEAVEFCNSFAKPYIKCIKIHSNTTIEDIKNSFINYYSSKAILFDKYDDKVYGGTGDSFNWNLLANKKLNSSWILAGGLNLSNIEDALLITGAKIVDISSGIEGDNFCKDEKKMKLFVDKINSFNCK